MGFSLKASNITPPQGEDLGSDLAKRGEALLVRGAEIGHRSSGAYYRARAATLFLLAAEAYEAGAAASIGHNRASRYRDAARNLRARAAEVEAAPA